MVSPISDLFTHCNILSFGNQAGQLPDLKISCRWIQEFFEKRSFVSFVFVDIVFKGYSGINGAAFVTVQIMRKQNNSLKQKELTASRS